MLYKQTTGEMFDASGVLMGVGYAGHLEGKNNPSMQDVPFVGPLPVGWYTLNPPADDPVVGLYAMRLIPDIANEMFGRNNFFWHGDSAEHPGLASDGCIVHARAIREKGWLSGDHRIQVVSGV